MSDKVEDVAKGEGVYDPTKLVIVPKAKTAWVAVPASLQGMAVPVVPTTIEKITLGAPAPAALERTIEIDSSVARGPSLPKSYAETKRAGTSVAAGTLDPHRHLHVGEDFKGAHIPVAPVAAEESNLSFDVIGQKGNGAGLYDRPPAKAAAPLPATAKLLIKD